MPRTLPATAVLLSLLCAGPVVAQSVSVPQPALDAYNDDYQRAWTRVLPPLQGHLERTVRDQLKGFRQTSGNRRVKVLRVRGVRIDLRQAPGFARVERDALELGLPVHGHWKLRVEADVRVGVKILGSFRDLTIPLKLTVDRLRVTSAVGLDLADPLRPVLGQVSPPDVRFRLRLDSRNLFTSLLLRLFSPLVDRVVHRMVDDALRSMIPGLSSLSGFPGPIPGDGAPLLTDSGTPTQLPTVVANLDRKVRQYHLPHGTLLVPSMDTPVNATWEQSYGAGGAGIQGQVVGYGAGKDSAFWTGNYLASQAFRYHVTGDSAALEAVRHALGGIGDLLDVEGGTGLLARVTAPLGSLMGQRIAQEPHESAQLHGDTWVVAENNHVSRDQYCGVYFGLGVAHDFVTDPAVRAECARRLQQMTDYLVAHDWFIDEDRPALDPTHPQGIRIFTGFPTFWAGNTSMKLANLQVANRASPGRYDAEIAREGALAPMSWVGTWLATFNLDGYYKFNLQHLSYFNYFRLESDPTRWQDMARGFRIDLRYVGHHKNPHFELIQVSIDPSLRATRHPAIREAMRRCLQRNHRRVTPPVINTAGLSFVTLTLPTFDAATGASSFQQVTLPSEPLDPALRYQTDFIWQRTPFKLAGPAHGNPRTELCGMDLILPYWMGREQGAF